MQDRSLRCSRRKFLASAAALTLGGGLANAAEPAPPPAAFRTRPPRPGKDGRKPIAVVCTVYRPMSHAYHIAGRFVHGYPRDGRLHVPAHYVHSLFVDQLPENDLSRALAREHDIRLARSVEEAVLDGNGRLAVEGVLLIGEHGNYRRNDLGQILYPRYEFMDQTVRAFRRAGRAVPVFNDKHLSHSWELAKRMVEWSRELKFPFLAGSSLPVTWRRPELELPANAVVEEALVAAHGPIEVYGFHALETLQCMVERRQGGETGVKAVTCLTGKEVWRAADAGRWAWNLLDAALARSETLNIGDVRANTGSTPVQGMPATPATCFLVEYRSGLRGTVLLLNGHVQDFTFAARLKGQDRPAACLFYLPSPPGAKYFDCLVANIEKLFETGRPPYPVERTLLTSGVLEAAMQSHHRRGERVETPHLEVRYAAPAESTFGKGSVAG